MLISILKRCKDIIAKNISPQPGGSRELGISLPLIFVLKVHRV